MKSTIKTITLINLHFAQLMPCSSTMANIKVEENHGQLNRILQENECNCSNAVKNDDASGSSDFIGEETIRLTFLSSPVAKWMVPIAEEFTRSREGQNVIVDIQTLGFDELFPEIRNEAQFQAGLYDGFITPPSVSGSIIQYDGWADLTPYIQADASRTAEWADILLAYRKTISQYNNKVIMFPLDGDVLLMYYRKDILKHFNLTAPRTWDEYSKVAESVHGKEFVDGNTTTTLIGSCVGRINGCAGGYWVSLVLSSITQTLGHSQGHLFDTNNMTPLTADALNLAIKHLEDQVKFGPGDGEYFLFFF